MSPMQAVMWKEWREHRWKLAFGTLMLAFFSGVLWAWGGISGREATIAVLVLGCVILSILSAMGTFAEDHAERTVLFLASRPIEPWQAFLGKWLIGWVQVVPPLVACGLGLALLRVPENHGASPLWEHAAVAFAIGWTATMLYSLTCCVTLGRRGPAGVGIGGLFWLGAMMLHMLLTESFSDSISHAHPIIMTLANFSNPISVVAIVYPPPWFKDASWLLYVMQVILFAGVLWLGLRNWKRSV